MPHSDTLAAHIDVYVAPDGSVTPLDPTLALQRNPDVTPAALVDLALGLLPGVGGDVEFVWTEDAAAPYWMVSLQRVRLGPRDLVRLRARRSESLPYGLTKRELDIVTLLAAGMPNPAIAESLGISTRTITTHVERVMRKMQVPSRFGVGAIAHDVGLFGVPLPIDLEALKMLRIARVVGAAGTRKPARGRAGAALAPAAPIVVGALVPITGRARADGAEMVQGAQLAVEEINARGGIHGRQLLLDVADVDVNSKAGITDALGRLMGNGASAIASGYLAHQHHAVEMAAIDGVPYLHASASSAIDDLVAAAPTRYRGVFQVCPHDRNYATNFVKFMTDLRDSGQWTPSSNELLVAAQSSWDIVDFGIRAASALAVEQGWDLMPLQVKDRELSEAAWAAAAQALGRAAAVMVGSYFVEDQVSFMRSFRCRSSQALVYSIYAPSIPSFRVNLAEAADGLIWASTTGTYSDGVAREFVDSFTARFGRAPGRSMAGIAYDRVNILAQAWAQSDDPHDFDAVAERLKRTRYRGLNGAYAFREAGQGTYGLGTQSNDPSLSQAHTTFQIQRGRNVLIGPKLYATGRFERPAWTSIGH
jgi:branched-chain amino acid transport system substrate-binding protein